MIGIADDAGDVRGWIPSGQIGRVLEEIVQALGVLHRDRNSHGIAERCDVDGLGEDRVGESRIAGGQGAGDPGSGVIGVG